METNDYRLVLVIKAVQGLTQMAGRSGNELVVNRDTFLYRGDAVKVPTISSNGLRHVAVREFGGRWLIDEYELSGRLSKEMLRLLKNGGNNASKSGGAESLPQNIAMRQYLPLLGLMGCGAPDGPKRGGLKMGPGVLICNETRPYVEVIAPELELPEWLRPARTCVDKWTEHRHDAVQHEAELLADPDERTPQEKKDPKRWYSGMIYGGECVMPGSLFVSEIHLDGCTVLELGALIWSLRLWQAHGGFVGGKSSHNNGRTVAMLHCDDDIDLDGAAEAYTAYAASVRDDAEAWLRNIFVAKEDDGDKPKRGKKAKAGATA